MVISGKIGNFIYYNADGESGREEDNESAGREKHRLFQLYVRGIIFTSVCVREDVPGCPQRE